LALGIRHEVHSFSGSGGYRRGKLPGGTVRESHRIKGDPIGMRGSEIAIQIRLYSLALWDRIDALHAPGYERTGWNYNLVKRIDAVDEFGMHRLAQRLDANAFIECKAQGVPEGTFRSTIDAARSVSETSGIG